ncbi:Imm50 family immunity protein [Streptomyces xanthophaeus]|uniref:Imm50 family immunity protein n=1 Tax=Streptomyces xanthophaeus TaxID=67385 RepID=UPI002648C13F|nr:Imm50 family immunity protein [Streptomyces xanthophaeus]WKD31643.1 immunity 50 family protein [Streptomyces xanthophaeus]
MITWPELQALYGASPVPDLDTCHFFHIHIDERGTSVTFGFETQQLPPYPEPEWSRKAYNTLRFWIEFTGVTELRVAGLLAEAQRAVRIVQDGSPTSLRVSVESERRSISFAATSARVSHTRVYLQGPL